MNQFLKVVFLGESGVGKTSLLDRFVNKKFVSAYKATIGSDFLTQEVQINDQWITLQLWDTAGQERFNGLGRAYYRGADCCFLVFDLTRPNTLQSLHYWKQQFEAELQYSQSFPFLVIGNRSDLESLREVTTTEALEWCSNNGNIPYIETSAKTGVNVEDAFLSLISEVVLKQQQQQNVYSPPYSQEVIVKNRSTNFPSISSCCDADDQPDEEFVTTK